MKIITLTLNPAFDLHCLCPSFAANRENIAEITDFNAAGKGVNISRALAAAGTQSIAVLALGKENADDYLTRVRADGLTPVVFENDGRIRENITLHHTGRETRISFPGFAADATLWSRVEAYLTRVVDSQTVLTVTGSLPVGLEAKQLFGFLEHSGEIGAKVVIDSRSFSAGDLLRLRPYLIKPNRQELSELMAQMGEKDEIRLAERLHRAGIENVLLSKGKDGALLCCREGILTAVSEAIRPVSTIGAGDASIAGFLHAGQVAGNAAERLSSACAFGAAACLSLGSAPPSSQEIKKQLFRVRVNRICPGEA